MKKHKFYYREEKNQAILKHEMTMNKIRNEVSK